MAKESYTIPRLLAEKFSFQHSLTELVIAKATAWGIPEEVAQKVQAQSTTYETKYELVSNRQVQSPSLTADRNASWNDLKGTIVNLYQDYLLDNDAISAADKETLYIHEVNSGYYSRYEAPKTSPAITLSTEDVSVLHVNYTTSLSSKSHRKPDGVIFCEVACKIGGDAPANITECIDHYNISHSHQSIVFNPDQRGSKVFAYARWVNRNGKNGPWSNQITAIIP